MGIERKFLGWDRPVVSAVREYLLPDRFAGPVDLESSLVIVPTRQAGRRLREELARYCSEQKSALLSPRVEQPVFFLHTEHPDRPIAGAATVMAVWSDLLLRTQLDGLNGLFPEGVAEQNFSWAMYTGKLIQSMRNDLVDGGYLIQDVLKKPEIVQEEVERWEDMARLEKEYLDRLFAAGLQDPCAAMIKHALNPVLPEHIERILLASVPDPTPLTIQALEKLAQQVPVTVLVHAPESEAGCFDEWGRPNRSFWSKAEIDVPNPEENIVLCATPVAQSRKVVDVISEEAARFGPLDIALGVPDTEVAVPVTAELEAQHLPVFDPAGKPLKSHSIFHLLELIQQMISERSYESISRFLRHPDVLFLLKERERITPLEVLQEWDRFQNDHLPVAWDSIQRKILDPEIEDRSALFKSASFIQYCIDIFEELSLMEAVPEILQSVYDARHLNPDVPEDEDFITVARTIRDALALFGEKEIQDLGLNQSDALELLVNQLADQHYYPDMRKALIDLEGWLELPWNDAPLLIVTGMNDGFVPDSRVQDVFLPDSVRRRLDLRSDDHRLARDAYLMTTLIESRRNDARVCFLAGKTSQLGDPLIPSRLLFRCRENELPDRVKRMFGQPGERRIMGPSSISFKLNASPPPDLLPEQLTLEKMSVTAFKDYLTCPFRFYLCQILDMYPLDDRKSELNPFDFGTLVHYALLKMGRDSAMKQSERESELSDYLHAQAEHWVAERYGAKPPLPVWIQLNAARQRLTHAAMLQAETVREGWEIVGVESKMENLLEGMSIQGTIDRVDRHRDTGVLRILDYKTTETARHPADDHIASCKPNHRDYARLDYKGKEKAWGNLQLPLYRLLYRIEYPESSEIQVGYFNLPKAVSHTEIKTWDPFDEDLVVSARACAEGVIRDIRDQRFWPATERMQYESFGMLFHGLPEACIDAAAFERYFSK